MLRCTGNNVAFTSAAHNAQRMCERPLTFMTVKCPCNVGLHIVNNSRPNNQWSENFDPCRIAGAPPNCIFPCGGRGPHNTWFLGLTQVHSPNGISIGSSVLAQLVVMFNRHTHTDTDADHVTSVETGRTLHSVHRCGLIKNHNNITVATGLYS